MICNDLGFKEYCILRMRNKINSHYTWTMVILGINGATSVSLPLEGKPTTFGVTPSVPLNQQNGPLHCTGQIRNDQAFSGREDGITRGSNIWVLRSLRHYLWAQNQGHHTIDHQEERGMERGCSRLKGQERAIIRQMNIGSIPKITLEIGWSIYGLFPAHRYHLELNWAEPRYLLTDIVTSTFSVWTHPGVRLCIKNQDVKIQLLTEPCGWWVSASHIASWPPEPLQLNKYHIQPSHFTEWFQQCCRRVVMNNVCCRKGSSI